jgi:hypothetical protein
LVNRGGDRWQPNRQPQRRGLRIHEVPVDWIDDADSRVHGTEAKVERNVAQLEGDRLRLESTITRARQDISRTDASILLLTIAPLFAIGHDSLPLSVN